MPIYRYATLFILPIVTANVAAAAPVDDACTFTKAIIRDGGEQLSTVVNGIAGHWTDANRTALLGKLDQLKKDLTFESGTVYQTGKLGDDLSDFIVVLRLKGGEVAGVRLSYEWYGSGLKLRTLDFRRPVQDFFPGPILGDLMPFSCP
jgi:hypothetical protein